jgi:ATP-dependent Clp protease protease subunit
MSVPYVIEKNSKDQERTYDIYSRLLLDRIIFIKGVFDQDLADAVTAQLLFLESADQDKDIFMYINSPGGQIDAMYSIYDTMTYVKPDVCTLAYGQACSAGSFILAAGAKGKRFALPNCNIMLHELSGGNEGKFHDIEVSFIKMKSLYEKMAKHYVEFTGQTLTKIKKDMKRDHYITSEEAVKYGLIDKVQTTRG